MQPMQVQGQPNTEPMTGAATAVRSDGARRPWEPPVLDALPLSATLNTPGPNADGTTSAS